MQCEDAKMCHEKSIWHTINANTKLWGIHSFQDMAADSDLSESLLGTQQASLMRTECYHSGLDLLIFNLEPDPDQVPDLDRGPT
jgi:hypothetical protein